MDNQQYLQQISAKPIKAAASAQNKFLTPNMIKLFAGLAIAIILIIVVMTILGNSGARAKNLTETLYTRISLLSKSNGPISSYGKALYSSNLRALSGNLQTNLSNVSRDLEGLFPDLGISESSISDKITEDEESHLSELTSTLETARLNAILDRTYSSQMTLEIAELLSIQSELYEKSTNQALLDLLHRSTTSLEALEIEFTDFTNRN